MILREQENNIKTWQSDPLNKAIYENATNPHRTAADDIKLRALEEQRKQRDYGLMKHDMAIQPELNEIEKEATKVLKFAYGVIQPKKIK